MNPHPESYSRALALSMILEASAWPKPGNVHRFRDNPDLRYEYFLATGIVAYRYFRRGILRGLKGWRSVVFGDLVYRLVSDVMESIPSSNTCLGSSMLLIPLSIGVGRCISSGKEDVSCFTREALEAVKATSVGDSVYYYKAVRKAAPSYLKPTDDTGSYVNVWDPEYARKLQARGDRLIDVLEYSSRIDVVAKELVEGYKRSLKASEFLRSRFNSHGDWNRAVVETYLHLLSENTDTVVLLKHGVEVAGFVKNTARIIMGGVLRSWGEDWVTPVAEFDEKLHERGVNPGSIADLTATAIALFMLENTAKGKPFLKA
ncbi:MAG: triphosphoribosyl-dephospho-CoA synthase [Desulfurococcus sp.]|nr:triphosphoribosyl-dephospho-CoA synthase [Desulfurococcus sp.]